MTFKIIGTCKNFKQLRGTIMGKTLSFGFIIIAILAIGTIFQTNAAKSNSVTIQSYGQIAYGKSASIQTLAPTPTPIQRLAPITFPWYQTFKELAWWIFGLIGTFGAIFTILEYKRKSEIMH
jgi:hypothetical protein